MNYYYHLTYLFFLGKTQIILLCNLEAKSNFCCLTILLPDNRPKPTFDATLESSIGTRNYLDNKILFLSIKILSLLNVSKSIY